MANYPVFYAPIPAASATEEAAYDVYVPSLTREGSPVRFKAPSTKAGLERAYDEITTRMRWLQARGQRARFPHDEPPKGWQVGTVHIDLRSQRGTAARMASYTIEEALLKRFNDAVGAGDRSRYIAAALAEKLDTDFPAEGDAP